MNWRDNDPQDLPPTGDYPQQPGNFPPPSGFPQQPGSYTPPSEFPQQPGNYPPTRGYSQPGNIPPPSEFPAQPPSSFPPPDGWTPYGRSRRRWLRRFLITLLVLVILGVGGDFGAKFFAQAKVASEIQQQGFPKKPSVTIEGFPFLTQVASRDIHQVRISSQNIAEGPVQISRISAVITGIHLNSSFSSGTVDSLSGTVNITFPALANTLTSQIGPLGSLVGASGLKLSAAGSDEVKASMSLLVASGSITWRITRLNGQQINVTRVSSSGLPPSLLGSISDFNIDIPKLPLGVKIDTIRITPEGVVGTISGHDLPFGS